MTLFGGGPVGRDQARELARRELQKPIYHRDEPSFLGRIVQKIIDWLHALLNRLNFTWGTGGGWVGLIVLLVVLAIVVAAIWWRIGRLRRDVADRRTLLPETRVTADDHRAAAEHHAAADDWPHAIRERLRAIARDLEERAIVAPRAGRTADELAAEAGAALPGHAEALSAGVRLFDDVWYGGRTGDAAGYRQMVELDDRLRAARPVPQATGGAR